MADPTYGNTVPTTPVPPSMLPRLESLDDGDIMTCTRPSNPAGQKSKSFLLSVLKAFILPDLGIVTAKIANLAVTTAKIANLAVTREKIQGGAVDETRLANMAVTFDKLGYSSRWGAPAFECEGTLAFAEGDDRKMAAKFTGRMGSYFDVSIDIAVYIPQSATHDPAGWVIELEQRTTGAIPPVVDSRYCIATTPGTLSARFAFYDSTGGTYRFFLKRTTASDAEHRPVASPAYFNATHIVAAGMQFGLATP